MKKQTKLLSLLISLALLLTILPSTVRAEGSQEEPQPVVGECEVFVTNHTVPEDDGYTEAELLEGYFFSVSGLYEDNSSPFLAPRPALPGELSSVYNEVKPMVKQVADGTRASTIFEIPCTWTKTKSEWGITGAVTSEGTLTADASAAIEAAFNLDALMQRMLSEMPYELYWFDKTEGIGMSYRISLSGEKLTVKNLKLSMYISQAYAKGGATYDPLTADTAKTSAAKRAAENATQVVADNTAKSDYEKLKAYLDYIKDAVSYNNEAANNNATPYGDPWQIIYVFDNNPLTNVVCEGYAKAFKHLCDLSSFSESDLFCSLVTGTMTVGTSAGPHMWNIVTIGGRNYLVDATNCDADTVGAQDKLFLCGAAENVPSKKYTATAGSQSIVYEYDAKTLSDYASSDLKLEEMPYSPTSVSGLTVSGTALSWNDKDNAEYYLYPSTAEDADIKAEWKNNTYASGAALYTGTGETITATTVDGKAMQAQSFRFERVTAGDYKLAIFKPGKYVPKIVSITVESTALDLGQLKLWLYGDVNYDGKVLANDATQIIRKANGVGSIFDTGDTLTKTDRVTAADLNEDGVIKTNDAAQITRFANGLGSAFNNFK